VGTRLAGSVLAREGIERTADDWCEAWCDGYTFHAVGGPHNLDELLAAFVSFAERHSASIEA
jgi:hypothetical protein